MLKGCAKFHDKMLMLQKYQDYAKKCGGDGRGVAPEICSV